MDEVGTQIIQLLPRLRRYARALAGDAAAADDLVQDTVERAYTKLHLWRRGSDLRAWLFTIMHNIFVNQVRSVGSQITVALEDHPADMPSRADQADMLEVRDIDAALHRLPSEQREVLLLVGLEHLSYAEAAKTLGIPIGTVMSRLARGRERLRLIMQPDAAPAKLGLKVVK